MLDSRSILPHNILSSNYYGCHPHGAMQATKRPCGLRTTDMMPPAVQNHLASAEADDSLLRRHEDTMLLLLTLVIGALVGLVVVVFILLTERLGARLYPAGASGWRRLLVPVSGALLSGILLQRYFAAARGSGIPQTKTAMFLQDGHISMSTTLGKFGCSSLSLASGIALGREGPSVQIGAGIASVIARRLKLRPAQMRRLVPVGASAALAAAFNTPIAAVLFSLEEVMGNLHAPVLGSVVLASATSWMVLHLLLGDEPLFHVPAYHLVHPIEFLVYAVLGAFGGVVSVAFVKLLLALRARFLRLPARTVWLQPAVGGLAVGLMGWFVPDVLGVGYGHVGEALNGRMAFAGMGLLLGLKLVATATAYASGNAGGIFGPSLFLGAMLGGVVGSAAHALLPDYTAGVGAYALVGMGAAFAGIIRVPMTSVIMIFEITRDYTIIVPLMIANMIAHLISARWQPEPIYEALLRQDGIHLPPGRELRDERFSAGLVTKPAAITLAVDERVADVIARRLPRAAQTVAAREDAPSPWERSAWPIVDKGGFVGVLTQDLLLKVQQEGRDDAILADLVASQSPEEVSGPEPTRVLYPDDSFDTALTRLAAAQVGMLPVVSRSDVRTLLGMVSLDDILEAYQHSPTEQKGEDLSPASPSLRRLVGGLAVAAAGVLLLVGGLGYYYREARVAKGQQTLTQGRQLLEQARVQEAIQEFRVALAATQSNEARLMLGEALLRADHAGESAVYFREVLRDDATNARANLGLARAAVEEGSPGDAALYYNRAIVGTWPDDGVQHRVEVRFELTDLLAKTGARNLAIAQLLELEREAPQDAVTSLSIGRRFLTLGASEQAAEVFRGLIKTSPRDGAARAGLAEAQFKTGDYASALASFQEAVKLGSSDGTVQERIDLCSEILALDPSRPGLRASERHARSLKLVETALSRLEGCVGDQLASGLEPPVLQAMDAARTVLRAKRRPASLGDATDQNVELARQLWDAGQKVCPGTTGDGSAAGLVLARLAR
jgi:CIC family chloride channel protein